MRKKKLRLLAVLLAACMLCSCSAPVYPRSTDEPQLQFYYCTGEGADTGIGALAARPVSVPDERPDAVLQQYLTAPAGEGFSLPDGLSSSCAFDSCEDGTLTLLGADKDKYIHQKGLNLSVEGANRVEIRAKQNGVYRLDLYLFGNYTRVGSETGWMGSAFGS